MTKDDSVDTASVPDNIEEGATSTYTKTLSEADVQDFAGLSGDNNRLHLDETYARDTRFGTRIVHGALVTSLISAALAQFPGVVIYLSQTNNFKAPVYLNDTVTATCTITDIESSGIHSIETTVTNEMGEIVIDGSASILIDSESVDERMN